MNNVKKLQIGPDFVAPELLTYQDIQAKPLVPEYVQEDMAAVNSSLEIIRQARGGSWPDHPVSLAENTKDLIEHHKEFKNNDAFAYSIFNNTGEYIGCFYLYAMGRRTPITKDNQHCDVDASWWVTEEAYQEGYYQKTNQALKQWLAEFPFKNPYFSNQQIPEGNIQ